ncbi:MAG: hypothetical protein ACNYPE_09465 [Candidatus Azotimanducaceae bacterium WSBS_2022_MAG_OTU7]
MAGAGSAIPAPKPDVADAAPLEEEDKIPDPYLVETGHILLDLISLEERTAAALKPTQGATERWMR